MYVIKNKQITYQNYQILYNKLLKLLDKQDSEFVLDLRHVQGIDSVGLSVFLSLYQKAEETKKRVKFIHVNEKIRDFLSMTKVDTVLEIQEQN